MNGVIVDGNRQAEVLTGYKKEELLGKNILAVGLLSRADHAKSRMTLERNLRGSRPARMSSRSSEKTATAAWSRC